MYVKISYELYRIRNCTKNNVFFYLQVIKTNAHLKKQTSKKLLINITKLTFFMK